VRPQAVIGRSAVNAAAIRACLGVLLTMAGVGCHESSTPTSLFLTIELEHAADPPPDEIRISVFGDNGVTFRDQRLPASGMLVPSSSTSLGTVTIYLPEKSRHARLDVRALFQGALRLEGLQEADVHAGKQVTVTVILRTGATPDGDGDGVPDAIDNCRMTVNRDQADTDGNGIGDLCQAPSDAGPAEVGVDAGQEGGADAAPDTGMDAAADTKMDTGIDAGTDARIDTADAGTDRASDPMMGTDTAADGPMSGADAAMEAAVGVDAGSDAPPSGLLTIMEIGFRADVDLTSEGTIDWAHWGAASATTFNHKATGGRKISDVAQRPDFRYSTSVTTFAWSDGTPTASDNNNDGVYDLGSSASFSITVPADTSTRTLRLYVGGNDVDNRLTVHLSDSSMPNAVFSTTGRSGNGSYVAPLEITFRAASAQQSLSLTWSALGSGGLTSLNAATLF
jgi:hypothetical protein